MQHWASKILIGLQGVLCIVWPTTTYNTKYVIQPSDMHECRHNGAQVRREAQGSPHVTLWGAICIHDHTVQTCESHKTPVRVKKIVW